MNYSDLVGPPSNQNSIANWCNFSLLPVPELLIVAHNLLYTLLRSREMKIGPFPINIVLGDPTTPLPTDFLDPFSFHDNFFNQIAYIDPVSLFKKRMTTMGSGGFQFPGFQTPGFQTNQTWNSGQPSSVAIFNEKLQFDVAPFQVPMAYYLLYFAKPAMLGTLNQTNFVTNRYSPLLRQAILAAAAQFR